MNSDFLIIGSGSIGKRHAKNLFKFGYTFDFVDTNLERKNELKELYPKSKFFVSVFEIGKLNYKGFFICTPTVSHVELLEKLLEPGSKIFLEKPLSISITDLSNICKDLANKSVFLGYTWRWSDSLNKLKSILDDGIYGNVLNVQMNMGAHLEDWHPWEDYRNFFMSKKEMGGGALLDESHWIDVMFWLFGKPNFVFGSVEKYSNLEITSDDNVDVVCIFNKFNLFIHLDLYTRPHKKSIEIICSNCTILWLADENQIYLNHSDGNKDVLEFSSVRNDMFLNCLQDYLRFVENECLPQCTYEDGIQVMNFIEDIRVSNENKKVIRL